MLIMLDSGRQIDTDFPAENNPNKVIRLNTVGILMDHGDKDGSFFFYPWSQVQQVITSNEKEKRELANVK
jgi:hypothetical protein